MKTIVTLDLADQAYGFPQLDGSGNLQATGSLHGTASYAENGIKYKVYTALLTQTGGSDIQNISSGAVTQGVTYQIDGADGASDFSNVGGPPIGTGDGTFFVATNSDVPNDYGAANLIYNNGAPVVTVLENTIGNIWFTYNGQGQYHANSNNLFSDNKVYLTLNQLTQNIADNEPFIYSISRNDTNIISLQTFILHNNHCNIKNDSLFNTPIEIRVYN